MERSKLSERQSWWLAHVEACDLTGTSMKAYAEKHGLNLVSFYCWKGQLKKLGVLDKGKPCVRPSAACLVPVKVTPASSPPAFALTRIELASGIVIEAPSDLDADALCDLLRSALAAGGR
ncbi:MAG: hypothetical protein V3U85_06695 [Hyphomicrobium sp.]